MTEEEKIAEQLTPAERWIFDNTQMITDVVLWSDGHRGTIPKEAYDENLESEIVSLLRFMPRIISAERCSNGIRIVGS